MDGDYVICSCGEVLRTCTHEKIVKSFHEPIPKKKLVNEVDQHRCQTYDFGAGLKKEKVNDNLTLG